MTKLRKNHIVTVRFWTKDDTCSCLVALVAMASAAVVVWRVF